MRRFYLLIIPLALFLCAPVWAGSTNTGPIIIDQTESADTNLITGKNSAGTTKFNVDIDGNITTADGVMALEFGLDDFKRVWTGSQATLSPRIVPGFTDGYPYLEANAVSAAIVWPQYHIYDRKAANPGIQEYWEIPDNETAFISPIQVVFKVPPNYRTGGAMVLTLEQRSGRSTNVTAARARIAYKYFMTTPGNYWADSQGVGTQYANVGTANYLLSPTEVTCAVSASDMTIDAGKWLVFQYARVRDEAVVDTLRHLAARFYFNPKY